jgi:plastocyanin domain-containing protein
VQVVDISVKAGFYSPNDFTVAAGQPVTVVFAGKATGCLSKPMFPSLNMKADFSSGKATLDLGTLKAGTYEFTCGMRMPGGKIVAQ